MTLPTVPSQITINAINNEMGQPLGPNNIQLGGPSGLVSYWNPCFGTVPGGTDLSISDFSGYDHSVGPSTPTGLSVHPGSTAAQSGSNTQDTHIYLSWNDTGDCANKYYIVSSSTSGGTYGTASFTLDPDTNDAVAVRAAAQDNANSTWFKVFSLYDDGGDTFNSAPSTAVQSKTSPTSPTPTGTWQWNGACTTLTFKWSNGTSPGERVSLIAYRWRLYDDSAASTGSWSSWASSSVYGGEERDVSITVDVDDRAEIEFYYVEENQSTTKVAEISDPAVCPE